MYVHSPFVRSAIYQKVSLISRVQQLCISLHKSYSRKPIRVLYFYFRMRSVIVDQQVKIEILQNDICVETHRAKCDEQNTQYL